MLRTMITATNTLSQVQQQLDTISSNIANSNTTGYKSQQANFTEMLYQQFKNDEYDKTVRQTPVGIRYGVGAKIGQIQSNQSQGSIQTTGRDLDFALTAKNQYFNVLMTDDAVQGKCYGQFITDGMVTLKEINLKNGNVGESYKLDRHYFPAKIQVYDGYVYYLFLDSRKQNGDKRSLYRLKIN